MRRGRPPLGLSCPGCGSGLEPLGEGPAEVHRLRCRDCGGTFRARRRSSPSRVRESPPVGGLTLAVRGAALRVLPWVYHAGVGLGTAALLACGGFVPALRGWLADEIGGIGDLVGLVGGSWVASETRDPDSDFGPALRRPDAPGLFEEVAEVARGLGVRPPEEIRLAFLPCCGVVAWRRSRALLLGLPLLNILSLAELRAVLGHELAHLARGDDARSAGSLRLVQGIGRSLDGPSSRGPLRVWARLCRNAAIALVGPIARGQEARADRCSATIAGGGVAASALVKVALVQPLFREVLRHHEPGGPAGSNLYATFRSFWGRLPAPLLEAMRLRLQSDDTPDGDSPHPPLPDRLATIRSYPDCPDGPDDRVPASALLGDLEWLEQMLHDRLYGASTIEPSVFHKAGT
jgi:hypothetical protein